MIKDKAHIAKFNTHTELILFFAINRYHLK